MKTSSLALLLSLATTPVVSAIEAAASQNAALRYWMAFASMENPPASEALAKRLEAASEGHEPWDDSLAEVVNRNRVALETMHRGARLPSCDWGLEDEMLAEAPIAHIARGRALARLNVLHGRCLLHDGHTGQAVDAWLSGIRFSRHLAAGGPWLGALVASAALETHFRALEDADRHGELDTRARRLIEEELAAMPEDGFDWSSAARREVSTLSGLATLLEGSEDPVAMLKDYFQTGHGPSDDETIADLLGLPLARLGDLAAVRAALRRTRTAVDRLGPTAVAAFQEPYATSIEAVREVDDQAAQDPTLGKVWPRSVRMNERRGRLVQARADLLARVRAR